MSALLRALGLGLLLAVGAAQAQTAPASAPAAAVATAQPGDTNAERAKVQPGNNAPMWRTVKDQGGLSSLPGAEKGVLIQPQADYLLARNNAGEAWREVRNRWLIPYGGSLLLIILLAMAIFYWRRGPMGGHEPDTGRLIERFTPFERAAHWANAAAFVTLAVSGLTMAFGKFILLPVIGSTLFGWLTYALKTAHNFVGPLFIVSLLVVIVTFIKDNIATWADFVWLSKLGGMFSDEEVPSHRFNAGEKGIFWWGVTIPGVVMVASGLVLDKLVPGVGELRGQMQIAHLIHLLVGIGMMALIAGHIYMGTVGMKGALDAMRTGYVDEGWAKEHHALWYEDIKAGKIPAKRSEEPMPASPRMQA